MPTILTVHGTNSSGPVKGNMWWQRGSAFEKHIRELVTSNEGEITWKPVIWDGWNSKTSRRKAGTQLSKEMHALEKEGENYTLIGHSHGGSVISAALMENADKKKSLDNMKGWFTVGTPFIMSEKEKYLFTRLGLFGKATYVALLTGGLFGVFSLWPALLISLNKSGQEYSFAMTIALLLLPFILFYAILSYMNRRKLHLYKPKTIDFAQKNFGERWNAFWHVNDEAIQGLKALKALNIDVFSKDFAVSPLNLLSLMLLPFMVITLLGSQVAILKLYSHAQNYIYKEGQVLTTRFDDEGELIGNGKDVLANANFLMDAAYRLTAGKIITVKPALEPLVKIILIPAFFVPLALLLMIIINLISRLISGLFSRILNPMTLGQLRATAYGSDVESDYAVDAREWPMWLAQGFPPLPAKLEEELLNYSNAAAAKAIPKFRNAVRDFSVAKVQEEKSDMMSDYLTWDELIHTSYFSIPRFRKLVAYTLTQTEGFEATEAFKQDPDYALVAAWHENLQSGKEQDKPETRLFSKNDTIEIPVAAS